MEVKKI